MRPRKHTNTHILKFLELSRNSNVSDPSPVILIQPRAPKTYARLKKPQYLVLAFQYIPVGHRILELPASMLKNP